MLSRHGTLGLIPADPITWKARRRAIVPAFHKRWLERMVTMFSEKTSTFCDSLEGSAVVDVEERFGSLALDSAEIRLIFEVAQILSL